MRNGRTAKDVPPPLELECLKALWALGASNVQAVRDHLAPTKPLAYTTVMTMLDRLTRKQVLERAKQGRSFVYKPLVSREEVQQRAVEELVEALFEGDVRALGAYLSENAPAQQAAAAAASGSGREAGGAATLDEALL